MSPWNARAVMMDKTKNLKPTDEPRMTFGYSHVVEELPGTTYYLQGYYPNWVVTAHAPYVLSEAFRPHFPFLRKYFPSYILHLYATLL